MSDSTVLVLLYQDLDGPNWANHDNWLSDAPAGEWYGVTVNRSGRGVRGLSLSGNDLRGTIPPELGNLSDLESLDLSDNRLRGSIPSELGRLSNLESLDLSNNQLEGVIPAELGRLRYLQRLGLDGNSRLNGCLSEGAAVPYCTSPANTRFRWDGETVVVSWDPVERATHYNIYWDDIHSSSCSLDRVGEPRWCEELAVEVSSTTYVHSAPDSRSNYYWITACHGDGCSTVDSENPARLQSN
ncbi:MAG: hypothetical protein OXG13_11710 [Gemmatimonadaceae bacterium]|nr:hypothetical protein [Gemmatimonadaceae bacterium]